MNMRECKHCGSKTYYRCTRYSGTGCRCYNFDGSVADNTHIYDYLSVKEGKAIYCEDCNKRLGYFTDDDMQAMLTAAKEG